MDNLLVKYFLCNIPVDRQARGVVATANHCVTSDAEFCYNNGISPYMSAPSGMLSKVCYNNATMYSVYSSANNNVIIQCHVQRATNITLFQLHNNVLFDYRGKGSHKGNSTNYAKNNNNNKYEKNNFTKATKYTAK